MNVTMLVMQSKLSRTGIVQYPLKHFARAGASYQKKPVSIMEKVDTA